MPIPRTCGHCEKTFLVPKRRSESVKFCSRECKTKAGWRPLICAVCETPFERKMSERVGPINYCSRNCFHTASKGVSKKPTPGRVQYSRVCEVCAVSFPVKVARKDTARFCSRACQSKSPAFRLEMSERQRGEKSWRWKGGEYKGKWGYVRVKEKRLSAEVARFIHRVVIEQAMLAAEPDHPFLIIVNGKKKLSPEIEVHHIDRNRSNNAFSNLLAVTKDAHAQIHHRNKKPEPWECWPRNPFRW